MADMYYNPKSDVFDGRVGRKLNDTSVIPRPYSHYRDQLRPGESLYMGLRGGPVTVPALVALIPNQATWDEFYGRYFSGMYSSLDLYAIRI